MAFDWAGVVEALIGVMPASVGLYLYVRRQTRTGNGKTLGKTAHDTNDAIQGKLGEDDLIQAGLLSWLEQAEERFRELETTKTDGDRRRKRKG